MIQIDSDIPVSAESYNTIECLYSKTEQDLIMQWHCRLGHCSVQHMCLIFKNVPTLSKLYVPPNFKCESCIMGKKTYVLNMVEEVSKFVQVAFLDNKGADVVVPEIIVFIENIIVYTCKQPRIV